jgi:hypothetical protein
MSYDLRENTRKALRAPLYQVVVEETNTGLARIVGPAMSEAACGMFADAIRKKIRNGAERTWANPTIVQVQSAKN